MKKYFYFWEKVDWYSVRVLNERENRAWAWIMFLFWIIAFISGCLSWNFFTTKIIVIIFFLDLFIRVIINPKYSPLLILWRFIVWNQKPEYVWASQKRFAWTLWLIIATIMIFLLVLNNIINPLTIILCFICLILLFFETSFWICIWCIIYNFFNKEKAKMCPWWVCEVKKKEDIQKIDIIQIIVLILISVLIYFITNLDFLKNSNIYWNSLEPINNSWESLPWVINNCFKSCGR